MAELHVLGGPNTVANFIGETAEHLVSVHASVAALIDASASQPGVPCIIDLAHTPNVYLILTALAEATPSLPVLVLGDSLAVEAIRALSRLKYWDTLPANAAPDSVLATLERLRSAAKQDTVQTQKAASECYAFLSTVGGAGASLLTVEAAYQLRQEKAAPSVCVVDLNFVDGMIAAYLNCEPGLSHAFLRKDPAALDAVLLGSIVTNHAYGFDIIATHPWTPDQYMPTREFVLQLLDITCEQYDVVLVDVPRWPTPWSRDVLAGCDAAVLVSELTVPALNATQQWIQSLSHDESVGPINAKAVLNRHKKNFFGTNVSYQQAAAALSGDVHGIVRSDWASALAAINLGQAVGYAKPNSVISKDISTIVRQLRLETAAKRETPVKDAA